MTPKTVVLLLNNPQFFLSHRVPLARAIQDIGNRVIIAVPQTPGYEQIREMGFEVTPIKLSRKGLNPLTEIMSILHIYKTLKKLNPQILHNFTIKPVIYGSIAGQLASVPNILNTITGLGYVFMKEGIKGAILRLIVGFLYRMAFFSSKVNVIFQNKDDKTLFLNSGWLKQEQCHVIRGSGVNTKKFQATEEPKGTPTILFPSRILYDKGIKDLIQASKVLKERGLKFSLLLAGPHNEGNPTDVPKEELLLWEKKGFAQWIGPQSDMPSLFKACNIVCLPSYREGLPLSLLEAMSSSRAIVTTDVPGCRETVVDGKNGILVPVKSPVDLALALETLIQDSQLRKIYGTNGRLLAEKYFSVEQIINENMKLYNQLSSEKIDNKKAAA